MTRDARPVSIIVFNGDSGITHYAISLGRALSVNRSVELLAGCSYMRQGYPEMPFTVRPFFRRSRYYPLDIARLFWCLLGRRDHIVLLQSVIKVPTLDGLLFRFLRLLGIRCVMTVHDVLPHTQVPTSRLSHRWLYGSFRALVVHSERARRDVSALGVRVVSHVVPHGVYDVFAIDDLSPEQARSRYSSFKSNDFVVLFFGRINRRKGIVEFLDLVDGLAAQSGIRFVIAGSNGIDKSDTALQSRLNRARANPRCLVVDSGIPFGEVQRYFRMSDMVALPYREGSTSGVLKLALAFGLPVVAADVGDLGEALVDGIGLLLPCNYNSEDFSNAVLRLRNEGKTFAMRGSEARKKYSWRLIGAAYDKVLREFD